MTDPTQDSARVEWGERMAARVARLTDRLHRMGLHDLIGSLVGAAVPVLPLLGQTLWVAQPALGLLFPTEEIDDWARLFNSEDGIAMLKSALDEDDK